MLLEKKQKGFTLVELMVAVAVFSIVMVVAMSALLNVIDANNKARAIKTAINNISFALESISKDMRVGRDYACSINGISFEADGNCSSGGKMIKYRSPRAYKGDDGVYKYAYYKFEGGKILGCLEKNVGDDCSTGLTKFQQITSDEVTIFTDKSRFYIIGANNLPAQPRMIMVVSGEAGSKDKIKTTFDLQTSVSQRYRKR